MRRAWFKDDDGTYFRNCACVEHDRKRALACPWLWRHLPGLSREWWDVFRVGVTKADRIGRFGIVLEARPFREAYPNHPGLWVLDERR